MNPKNQLPKYQNALSCIWKDKTRNSQLATRNPQLVTRNS